MEKQLITMFFLIFTVNEILGAAAKERSVESPSTEESKSSKGLFTRLEFGISQILEN